MQICLKKHKKRFVLNMESRSHEWEIPLSSVLKLLQDKHKERLYIVYEDPSKPQKHKHVVMETHDEAELIQTYFDACLLSHQTPEVQSLEAYTS